MLNDNFSSDNNIIFESTILNELETVISSSNHQVLVIILKFIIFFKHFKN